MQEAKRRIPHFTLVEEYDVTALERTRQMMNADRGSNPKLTLLPFLITAMARTLADYPQINATYDDDAQIITRSGAVHMGMATQTPNGLMVPVIRNAERRTLWDIAAEDPPALRSRPNRQGGARRALRLDHHHLQPRPDGRDHLDPGDQPPGSRDRRRQQGRGEAGRGRRRARDPQAHEPLASCDHRVVDGWDAANFMQDLKKLIENPLQLLS